MKILIAYFCVFFALNSYAQINGISEECQHKLLGITGKYAQTLSSECADSLLGARSFYHYLCLRQEKEPGYLKHIHHRSLYRNKALNYLEGRNILFLNILVPEHPDITIRLVRNRDEEQDSLASIEINGEEFIDKLLFDADTRGYHSVLEDACEGYLKASEAYFVEQADGDYIYLYLFFPNTYYSPDLLQLGVISEEEIWQTEDCVGFKSGYPLSRDYWYIVKMVFSYSKITRSASYVSYFTVGFPFRKCFLLSGMGRMGEFFQF